MLFRRIAVPFRRFATGPVPAVPKRSPYVIPGLVFSGTIAILYFYYQKEKAITDQKKFMIAQNTRSHEGKAKVGGPFRMLNHEGQYVTEADFAGKYMVLYFGFTHCPDICPDELDKVTVAIEKLEQSPSTQGKVIPIFVSVDPKRDGPEQIKKYLKGFHPNFVGLTGTPEEVIKFAKAYRVYCSQNYLTEGSSEYLVDHSVFFYLMGPYNEFVDFFGREVSPEDLAERITHHVTSPK